MWILSLQLAVVGAESAAAAAPDAAELERAWTADAALVALHGAVPTSLDRSDLAALARGDVVAHRVVGPEGAFATGAVWLPVGLEPAWVTIQDQGHRPLGRAAAEERLPEPRPGHRRMYLRLALPWPVADRQWVAELANNRPLYEATGGRVWQRHWTLGDRSLAPHPSADAVWVEENRGAWTLLPAGEGTLVVIALRSVIGGTVPAEISQSWATRGLVGMLRTLSDLAPTTAAHYSGAHEVVLTPDGRPVPKGP